MTKYVALQSIRYKGADGMTDAKPFVAGQHSGVFETTFDSTEFARLSEFGAIRLATKADIAASEDDVLEARIAKTPAAPQLAPAPEDEGEDEPTELEDMSVAALQKIVADDKVTVVGKANKKADLIASIKSHREAVAKTESAGEGTGDSGAADAEDLLGDE